MIAEKIDLVPVASSNLKAIGYNPDKQIAAVQFKSGEIYHYAGASEALMAEWYAALSLGQFYTLNVKGKLSGQKMTGECPQCGARHGWVGDTCNDCGSAVYLDTRENKGAKGAESVNVSGTGREAEEGCRAETTGGSRE